ncbi:MAG: OmpA family protein [Verrucomicrobiales bacterium]|nr:OmpA family protein [Verrucomicrobiales bacterium]
MISVFLWFSQSLSAQITADTIATHCHNDSGIPKENYLEYGEKLAKTLALLSPAALARVLETSEQVLLSAGDSLNEALDLENIEFPIMSSTLPTAAKGPLGSIAEYLVENPGAKIEVEGHVSLDFFGAQALSEARANAAKDYLISLGIDESRIETVGKGFTEPIEGSMKENQRIEFLLKEL